MVYPIAIIIAALAAGAAFWAAFEAKRSAAATQGSAKATMDTAEAALIKSFFDDYFDQNHVRCFARSRAVERTTRQSVCVQVGSTLAIER